MKLPDYANHPVEKWKSRYQLSFKMNIIYEKLWYYAVKSEILNPKTSKQTNGTVVEQLTQIETTIEIIYFSKTGIKLI